MKIYKDRSRAQHSSRFSAMPGQRVAFIDHRNNRQVHLKGILQRSYCKFDAQSDSLGRASKVHAEIYDDQQNLDGGSPTVNPVGWNWLSVDAKKNKWVRFHILNQYLGGLGNSRKNLVPATRQANSGSLWRDFEEGLKEAARNYLVIFDAEVQGYYSYPSAPDNGFPRGIVAHTEIRNPSNRTLIGHIPESTALLLPLDPPQPGDGLPLTVEYRRLLNIIEREPLADRRKRLRKNLIYSVINQIAIRKLDVSRLTRRRLYEIAKCIQEMGQAPDFYGPFWATARYVYNEIIWEQRPDMRRSLRYLV